MAPKTWEIAESGIDMRIEFILGFLLAALVEMTAGGASDRGKDGILRLVHICNRQDACSTFLLAAFVEMTVRGGQGPNKEGI